MVRILARNIQATNMISSFASVFLAAGIIMEEWVVLKLETQTNPISHSPWICCSSVWPEENLEVVRIMMVLVLSLSFIYIFFLGLELFYRIRQTKHVLYIMVFLSFFTGILLLCALLYQQKLRQGESVYYSSYKITWIIFTAYLSVFFFIVSGFLSLLEHKQSIRGCACLTTIDKPAKESQDLEPSGTSVTVVLLPERTAMP
ncbi:Transmembrane protein 225 [Manis javanica]|nr:Transmembrane protein 225 [Manis javanica]